MAEILRPLKNFLQKGRELRHWPERLGIEVEDIPEFQEFFGLVLQTRPFQEQYRKEDGTYIFFF
jgi:hypothetical protein